MRLKNEKTQMSKVTQKKTMIKSQVGFISSGEKAIAKRDLTLPDNNFGKYFSYLLYNYISIRFWVLFETKLYLFIQQFTVDRKEIVISKNIVSSNPKLDCGRMRKTKATLF